MTRHAPLAAIGAGVLAAVAAIVASKDGDADIVPFFVGLTLAAGVQAWAVARSGNGPRRVLAWAVAGGWTVAAIWIGVLLLMYQAMCACSFPPRPPEETYLGLTATVYHLVGVYGGGALSMAAAIGGGIRCRED